MTVCGAMDCITYLYPPDVVCNNIQTINVRICDKTVKMSHFPWTGCYDYYYYD